MDLQSPSVLAQLPRPLHASTGKTRIGDVYSLADSKKRKRYEVAVAVDGEAINIYNVGSYTSLSLCRELTLTYLPSSSGANTKARHFICSPTSVDLLLPPMFHSSQNLEEGCCSETDLRRSHKARASNQMFCRGN